MIPKDAAIALLISGGVDSSVALHLLYHQGYYNIHAYYLKIWLEDELSYLGTCPWEEDMHYAHAVCALYNIPLTSISLQQSYYKYVVQYTIDELRQGLTPSPDIFCNKRIKFGVFYDMLATKCDYIASGHYARIVCGHNNEYFLQQGVDPKKDQSYFLSHLEQKQLQKLIFPIGHLTKQEVRTIAHTAQLPTASRKDSQGICFLGSFKYNDFVKHYLGEQIGEIYEYETNKYLGTHHGIWFHTIGQRTGLGLSHGPWYVIAKDCINNIIFVSHQHNQTIHQASKSFSVEYCSWIANSPPDAQQCLSLTVKLRHGPKQIPCRITHNHFHARYHVSMDKADYGIAPGQFATFYHNDYCLGAGKIITRMDFTHNIKTSVHNQKNINDTMPSNSYTSPTSDNTL